MHISLVDVRLQDIASLDDAALNRRFRSNDVVVLVIELASLVTFLGLAPRRQRFGQEWWLGQGYSDWRWKVGSNRRFAEGEIAKVVRSAHTRLADIPWPVFNIGGWFAHAYKYSAPSWNPDSVISVTLPLRAQEDGRKAILKSEALIAAHLLDELPGANSAENRPYGISPLEESFPIGRCDGLHYLHDEVELRELSLPEDLPAAGLREQQSQLKRFKKLAGDLLSTPAKRDAKAAGHRTQRFSFLNALEFHESLWDHVREINGLRSSFIASTVLPHFYAGLTIQQLDPSNTVTKKPKRLLNDFDWVRRLARDSESSFCKPGDAVAAVTEYESGMRRRFPCLGTDPFGSLTTLR